MIKAWRQDSGLSVVRSIAADPVLILMGSKCDVDEREAFSEVNFSEESQKISLERLYRVGVRGQQRLLVGKWGFRPEVVSYDVRWIVHYPVSR